MDEVRDLVRRAHGVLARSEHPNLVGAIEWLQRRGELVAVLPGVLASPAVSRTFEVRVLAVARWDPDAVITGHAAARLGYWPQAPDEVITVITRRRLRPRPGYRFIRAHVDPQDVVERPNGTRHTSATWTALWLARWDEGEATDEALRASQTSPAALAEGLAQMKGRIGASTRRFVADNSTEHPWSVAERKIHLQLREAGIKGWSGNEMVQIGLRRFPVDILFRGLRLAIEFDGYETHSRREVFHQDREKALLLMADGWLVVRFSHPQIQDPEVFIGWVRAAMAMAAKLVS